LESRLHNYLCILDFATRLQLYRCALRAMVSCPGYDSLLSPGSLWHKSVSSMLLNMLHHMVRRLTGVSRICKYSQFPTGSNLKIQITGRKLCDAANRCIPTKTAHTYACLGGSEGAVQCDGCQSGVAGVGQADVFHRVLDLFQWHGPPSAVLHPGKFAAPSREPERPFARSLGLRSLSGLHSSEYATWTLGGGVSRRWNI
jgi:hypothetical protein